MQLHCRTSNLEQICGPERVYIVRFRVGRGNSEAVALGDPIVPIGDGLGG